MPSSLVQKYIRIKRIKVNKKGAKADLKISVGDVVEMYINDEFFEKPSDDTAYLKVDISNLIIVYEDENIMIVNKPAGVLCHSDKGYEYSTIIARVQAYLHGKGEWKPGEENSFAPALCNRIDRNTSGIVIAAKNAETLRIINEKIKNFEIDKYYLAVVYGKVKPSEGKLEGYIFKDAVKNRVYVTKYSKPGSKYAAMEYHALSSMPKEVSSKLPDIFHDCLSVRPADSKAAENAPTGNNRNVHTILECKLITGRTHQIRAQLADIGHPVVGDTKYGKKRKDETGKSDTKSHYALCSYKLNFSFKTDAGILNYLKDKTFCI